MNYYDILNIKFTATETDIKIAYRKLAKIHHPDLNKKADGKKFIEITRAYQTLINPVSRKEYDLKQGTYTNSKQQSSKSQWSRTYSDWNNMGEDPFADFVREAYEKGFNSENIKDFWENQQNKKQYKRSRKTLTREQVKTLLREDIAGKKAFTAKWMSSCNFCYVTIQEGDTFFFVGEQQKMCEQCQDDVLTRL